MDLLSVPPVLVPTDESGDAFVLQADELDRLGVAWLTGLADDGRTRRRRGSRRAARRSATVRIGTGSSQATLVLGKKLDRRTDLAFVIDYDGNRSVFPDVPLPGIAYRHADARTIGQILSSLLLIEGYLTAGDMKEHVG